MDFKRRYYNLFAQKPVIEAINVKQIVYLRQFRIILIKRAHYTFTRIPFDKFPRFASSKRPLTHVLTKNRDEARRHSSYA